MAFFNPMSDEEYFVGYGDNALFIDSYSDVECESDVGLARAVLDQYNINTNETAGGSLDTLDIKQMDATTVLKMSLIEDWAKGGVKREPVVVPDNNGYSVEFREVEGVRWTPSDLYYTIENEEIREASPGVMVMGGKPLPQRDEPLWKPIWTGSVTGGAIVENPPDYLIYDTTAMTSTCTLQAFSQYATIVFMDPNLSQNYEDGMYGLFDEVVDNPDRNILGYSYYLKLPPDATRNTKVTTAQGATIPIQVGTTLNPDLGTLQPRQYENIPLGDSFQPSCFIDAGAIVNAPEVGVQVVIDPKLRFIPSREGVEDVDTFKKINSVYVIGQEVIRMNAMPLAEATKLKDSASITKDEVQIKCDLIDDTTRIIKLVEGEQYAVGYDVSVPARPVPYLVFANNMAKNDPGIENGAEGAAQIYGKDCKIWISPPGSIISSETGENIVGSLLPIADGRGVIVDQIWAVCEFNLWSVTVQDAAALQNGDITNPVAKQIAEELEYWITPITNIEPKAPIGYNGDTIDPNDGLKDSDPTTVQNLSNSPYQLALDEMSGGGLTLTYSFLTEQEQVNNLSGDLQEYMGGGNGRTVTETTYICGPEEDPPFPGDAGPGGGIVNSVTFNYSDSSSYTISVNEGEFLKAGLAQVNGGPTMKMVEEVSAKGLVLEDFGNAIHYKIYVEGYGDIIAISGTPDIIRVGDRVNVAIHNNPVED